MSLGSNSASKYIDSPSPRPDDETVADFRESDIGAFSIREQLPCTGTEYVGIDFNGSVPVDSIKLGEPGDCKVLVWGGEMTPPLVNVEVARKPMSSVLTISIPVTER